MAITIDSLTELSVNEASDYDLLLIDDISGSSNDRVKKISLSVLKENLLNDFINPLTDIRFNLPKLNSNIPITITSTRLNQLDDLITGDAEGNIPTWSETPSDNQLVVADSGGGIKTITLENGFNPHIEDSLNGGASSVLSAKQGKILNTKIEGLHYDASGVIPSVSANRYNNNFIVISSSLDMTSLTNVYGVLIGSFLIEYEWKLPSEPLNGDPANKMTSFGSVALLPLPTDANLYDSDGLTKLHCRVKFLSLIESHSSNYSNVYSHAFSAPLSDTDVINMVVSSGGNEFVLQLANEIAMNTSFIGE